MFHNFCRKPLTFIQLLERSLLLYGREVTVHPHNKILHSTTHHNVQWRFGSVIEDNAYMGAVAREFSYVFRMADTSS